MPLSARLSRKLYETFGEDAGRDMVDWMQQIDAQRAEMRELFDQQFVRIRDEIGGLRQELTGQISSVRTAFRHDLDLGLARLETKIEQRTADLMRWSFVFWVGAAGAIALLAGVMK